MKTENDVKRYCYLHGLKMKRRKGKDRIRYDHRTGIPYSHRMLFYCPKFFCDCYYSIETLEWNNS